MARKIKFVAMKKRERRSVASEGSLKVNLELNGQRALEQK